MRACVCGCVRVCACVCARARVCTCFYLFACELILSGLACFVVNHCCSFSLKICILSSTRQVPLLTKLHQFYKIAWIPTKIRYTVQHHGVTAPLLQGNDQGLFTRWFCSSDIYKLCHYISTRTSQSITALTAWRKEEWRKETADIPPSKVDNDLCSTRQILALFRGQPWGDCWETGRSAYGPFRALRCHLELKLKLKIETAITCPTFKWFVCENEICLTCLSLSFIYMHKLGEVEGTCVHECGRVYVPACARVCVCVKLTTWLAGWLAVCE